MKNYIEMGKVAPEDDSERLELNSLIGKRITKITYHCNRYYFFSNKKVMFSIPVDGITDKNGNYFCDVEVIEGL